MIQKMFVPHAKKKKQKNKPGFLGKGWVIKLNYDYLFKLLMYSY